MNNDLLTKLRAAEQKHSELLTKAGQAPANSSDRERLLQEADKALRRINEIHEEMNPTPFA